MWDLTILSGLLAPWVKPKGEYVGRYSHSLLILVIYLLLIQWVKLRFVLTSQIVSKLRQQFGNVHFKMIDLWLTDLWPGWTNKWRIVHWWTCWRQQHCGQEGDRSYFRLMTDKCCGQEGDRSYFRLMTDINVVVKMGTDHILDWWPT